MTDLPELSDWRSTRDGLHAYSHIPGEIRKHLAPPHPLWWHASLQVVPEGLTTGSLSSKTGSLEICQVLSPPAIVLRRDGVVSERISLESHPTPREVTTEIQGLLAADLEDLDPSKLSSSPPQPIDSEKAENFHAALLTVQAAFQAVRAKICGNCSPIQIWPHHFDLSFEWFGAATEGSRAQIGFGFSPGDTGHEDPYFYANPWPFDPSLSDKPLPGGAGWHLEDWQGSLLPYADVAVAGTPLLHDFLAAVHKAASPGLS